VFPRGQLTSTTRGSCGAPHQEGNRVDEQELLTHWPHAAAVPQAGSPEARGKRSPEDRFSRRRCAGGSGCVRTGSLQLLPQRGRSARRPRRSAPTSAASLVADVLRRWLLPAPVVVTVEEPSAWASPFAVLQFAEVPERGGRFRLRSPATERVVTSDQRCESSWVSPASCRARRCDARSCRLRFAACSCPPFSFSRVNPVLPTRSLRRAWIPSSLPGLPLHSTLRRNVRPGPDPEDDQGPVGVRMGRGQALNRRLAKVSPGKRKAGTKHAARKTHESGVAIPGHDTKAGLTPGRARSADRSHDPPCRAFTKPEASPRPALRNWEDATEKPRGMAPLR